MQSTAEIATGKKSDVFFVRHISTINPSKKIPLQGVEWLETVNAQGSRVTTEPVPFEQGYLPESLQGIRFPFSVSNGYVYDLDVLGRTEEELNKNVNACALLYIKGKNKDEVISKSNPRNADDPFFSHPDLTLKLQEFGGGYDLSEPRNKVLYALIKPDPRFLVIEDETDVPDFEQIHPNVEFLVTKTSIKDAVDQKKGLNIMEMYAKLEKASLAELKVISSIWGDVLTNEDTSEKVLKQQFAFRFDSKKKVPGTTKTYAESFMELIQIKGEKLNTKYLIKVAKQLGVIRMTNIGFTFNNNPMGNSEEAMEAFLLNPNNSAIRSAIQLEVNGNKTESKATPLKEDAEL